jgi:hypothetical protein
VVQP